MSTKKTGAATAAPDSTQVENQATVQEVSNVLEARVAELEAENAALKAKTEVVEAENEELKEELEEAAKIVAELKSKLQDGGTKDVTVTVDKQVYIVTKGFREKTKTWRPEDIAANPAKAKELIEKGSTILKLKKK